MSSLKDCEYRSHRVREHKGTKNRLSVSHCETECFLLKVKRFFPAFEIMGNRT